MNRHNPNMIPAALIGGVFLGVSSALPVIEWFNCACCILVIGGGLLASFIVLRDYPEDAPPFSYGDGALLGLSTGLIGGLVWTAVEIPIAYFQLRLGMGMEDLAELQEVLNDPEIPPIVQELVSNLLTGGTLSLGIVLLLLLTHIVTAVIFAAIGGIIGVALFQPKRPVTIQSPSPPRPRFESGEGHEKGDQSL